MDSNPMEGLSISKIQQKISITTNATGNDELIEMVSDYLKFHKQDYTRFDAIRWINNMKQTNSFLIQRESDKFIAENDSLILKSQNKIQHFGLVHYINEYCIPIEIAKKYLLELKVFNKDLNKDFFVLGCKNEDDGFEIRSPFIKGCVGQKGITFIRGTKEKSGTIHIYKSFWDYLSLLSHLSTTTLSVDTIILNSLVCLKQAISYIQNYGYQTAYTWMDNYALGEQATYLLDEFFKTESGLKHIPMNKFYSPYTDVSKWYQRQIKSI